MTDYSLPYFGTILIHSLQEEYETEIELNGRNIRIDIHFKNQTVPPSDWDSLKAFLEMIPQTDVQNKTHIVSGYADETDTTVKEYIEFHLEELDREKLARLIDFDHKTLSPEQQLIEKLTLERIGLYPDGAYESAHFAVFDYTPEGNVYVEGRRTITDQILVVATDAHGNINSLAWES